MASKKNPTGIIRHCGGQPGNRNAFKHGFYAKKYFPLEISDLDTALGEGLLDEIALLRVTIRRVFEIANDCDQQDLDTWCKSLNTLGTAATRLAGLLRANQVISGGQGNTLELLAQQFGKVAHELGYTDPSAS